MLTPSGRLAIAFCALVAASAASAEEALVGDPQAGRAVAVGASSAGTAGACQACHGIDGAGDAAAGFPRLSGLPPLYLAKALADYAAGRRNDEIMTPIARELSERERQDVSAFYAGTTGRMIPLVEEVDPALLQAAAVISAVGDSAAGVQGCINCHGPDGQGMGVQYPPLAGQSALYLEAQLRAFKEGRRTGDTANVMHGIASRLGDAQIRGLSRYFSSITARLPGDATAAAVTEETR